jgi:hypothetical protein
VDTDFPCRFLAIGLRVTVKQPGSYAIPCFSVAILLIVTWIDVCPTGWHDWRMEFLGRTALLHLLLDEPMVQAHIIREEKNGAAG